MRSGGIGEAALELGCPPSLVAGGVVRRRRAPSHPLQPSEAAARSRLIWAISRSALTPICWCSNCPALTLSRASAASSRISWSRSSSSDQCPTSNARRRQRSARPKTIDRDQEPAARAARHQDPVEIGVLLFPGRALLRIRRLLAGHFRKRWNAPTSEASQASSP